MSEIKKERVVKLGKELRDLIDGGGVTDRLRPYLSDIADELDPDGAYIFEPTIEPREINRASITQVYRRIDCVNGMMILDGGAI